MMTFVQFAESCGLVIRALRASDTIQRCGTAEHPRSTNGAYLWDGERGGCMAWDGDGVWRWYGGERRELTADEKRAWAMRQREAEAERERAHRRAAMAAEVQLGSCRQIEHAYLKAKGFASERGMVAEDESLHVPMRDFATNALRGTQRIEWDGARWTKKMTFGMKAKGAVFRMGRPTARESWLVEGYATGLSVAAALRQMCVPADVIVTFSATNMMHVAPMIKGTVFVFADNDASGTGEDAAQQIGRPYCMAPTVGHDANDWHQASGLIPVSVEMMKLRRTRAAA